MVLINDKLNPYIYLDNNATTQVDNQVLDFMLPFLKDNFANANSTHHFGQQINRYIQTAREQTAEIIGAQEDEIIFTSGATEAINLALKGIAESYVQKGNHIVTVSTEHKAVLDTCKYLESKGYDVTYLPVDTKGLIDLQALKASLRSDTILVCIMYVNNETGVIHPIKEISAIVHEAGALFMTDATQAVGKIEIDVTNLDVDILCFSGHKFYAPKGVGALYFKKNVKIFPYLHGGGHEMGLRSGTLNVPSIVALGKACEISHQDMKIETQKIELLRNILENELLQIPDTFVNGDKGRRIYNVSNICFKGYDANVMIGQMKNIAVSNGSACTAAVFEPSHVLTAMGLSNDDAFASIRFSLGKYNTEDEVRAVVQKIKELTNLNYRYA